MKPTPLIRATIAVAAALLVGGGVRPAAGATHGDGTAPVPVYGWPVKPFDRQHPVRAFLNDPRIGHEGGRAFHFGIDVAAPDGTPVYAVTGGIVYLSHGSLAVQSAPHHEFGYWHIRRAAGLRHRQVVARHQLLGTIAPGWGHVHFAEHIGDVYVNPLRPGGLGPYTDSVRPTIASISVTSARGGALQVVARAYDTTWPPVPGPWRNQPVTPALLRWRVSPAGRPAGSWRTAVDFSRRMLDRRLFTSVYAPQTAQNHERRPGTYAFFLARDWRPADGIYSLEVAASDMRGNRAVAHVDLAVVDGAVERVSRA